MTAWTELTIPAFEPPFWPSPGAQTKPEIKLLQAEFGDGYSQAAPAGLNHIRNVQTLSWELLEPNEKDYIVTFFERQGGHKPFYFALPTDHQTKPFPEPNPRAGSYTARHAIMNGKAATKWTCADWTVTAQPASMFNITATFRQYFGNLT